MSFLPNKSKIVYLFVGLVIITAVVTVLIPNIERGQGELNQIAAVLIPNRERGQEELNQIEIMQWNNPPEVTIDKNANYTAVVKTNKGDIKIELFARENPITVNNFVFLAQQGFYDGIIFHRVISDFMIQGGCPLGTGVGGPGYVITDEFSQENRNNRGTISMANAGPNTGGSQFFINLVNNNFLDGRHPVFGKVTEGMEVVDLIGNTATTAGDRPVQNIVIESIEIIKQ